MTKNLRTSRYTCMALVAAVLSCVLSAAIAAPAPGLLPSLATEGVHGVPAGLFASLGLLHQPGVFQVADASDAQPPPQFSVSVSAQLNQTITAGAVPTYSVNGTYTGSVVRDMEEGVVMQCSYVSTLAPEGSEAADLLLSITPSAGYTVLNNVCMDTDGAEFDMFDTITSMEYVGDEECPEGTDVTGDCQLWTFQDDSHDVAAYVYSMSEDVAVPVQLAYTVHVETLVTSMFVVFTDYDTEVDVEEDFFDEPEVCNAPFYEPCGSIPQYGTLDLYMYSAEPPTTDVGALDLSDTYMADVHGTASWLCINGADNDVAAEYPYITRVTVTLDENWGIMGESGSGRVQRSGSEYYGDANGGQCSGNEDIGSWYYLPHDGGCADEPSLRVNATCFWAMSTSVKTVATDCLLTNGLFSSCTAEGYQIPFAASSEALVAAFDGAEDDAGFCADVVAHSPVPTPVVPVYTNYTDSPLTSEEEFEDGGDYLLAVIFTVITLVLCVVAVLLGLVAYKKKELIRDGLSQLSFMTKGPDDGFQRGEWNTLSEGGSNGLLDGDLMDDDDLDLTFD